MTKMEAECQFLETYNQSRGVRLGCPNLNTCTGVSCSNPDQGIQGFIKATGLGLPEDETDIDQNQALLSLLASREQQ